MYGEANKFVDDLWLRELAREKAKSGTGGNKLRTYQYQFRVCSHIGQIDISACSRFLDIRPHLKPCIKAMYKAY